jgi:hypothetical protein
MTKTLNKFSYLAVKNYLINKAHGHVDWQNTSGVYTN